MRGVGPSPRTWTAPSPPVCHRKPEHMLSSPSPVNLILVVQSQTSVTWKLSFCITEWPLRQSCGGLAQWHKDTCQELISSHGRTETFWEEIFIFVVENASKNSTVLHLRHSQVLSAWKFLSYRPKCAPQKPKTAFAFSQSFCGAVWAHGGC